MAWQRIGLVVCLSLSTFGARAEGPQISVETLQGESLQGTLAALTATALTLTTSEGPRELPVSELLEIRPSENVPALSAEGEVRLTDGGRMGAAKYITVDKSAQFTHPRYGELKVALDRVASMRFLPAEAATLTVWNQLLERPLKKDLLAIRKAEVVDHLDGLIGAVDDKTVKFVLDGDEVPVKRERVFGLVYLRRESAAHPVAIAMVDTVDGDRLPVKSLTWADGKWQAQLASGVELQAETGVFRVLDFSLGKVLYLSSIEPRAMDHTEWWDEAFVNFTYRRNRNFDGRPLRLGGKTWQRGLAIHSLTTLTYRMGGDYRRFVALAGIDDDIRNYGDVDLIIRGDGKPLFQGTAKVGQPPQPLDLDVTGVVELEITVDFGRNESIGDRLHLVDARVTK